MLNVLQFFLYLLLCSFHWLYQRDCVAYPCHTTYIAGAVGLTRPPDNYTVTSGNACLQWAYSFQVCCTELNWTILPGGNMATVVVRWWSLGINSKSSHPTWSQAPLSMVTFCSVFLNKWRCFTLAGVLYHHWYIQTVIEMLVSALTLMACKTCVQCISKDASRILEWWVYWMFFHVIWGQQG